MRITCVNLPEGCIHIRVHLDESPDYISHTIIVPLSDKDCEIAGFAGKATLPLLRLIFKKCKELGYETCKITRRNNNRTQSKVFNLSNTKYLT